MSTTEQPTQPRQTREQRYEELIDSLDPKLKGKADYGASAARKAMLSRIPVPNHQLARIGIEVPHREYLDDADDRVTRKTTLRCEDGTRVHLHQDVREADDEDTFGSFGAAEDDVDDVIWTVVGLDDGTVDLTVVGEWSRRRHVPYDEFADEYEPLYLADGQPKWGY
ncbi:hypothetical protein EXE43_21340 [Halorubrum sp. SS5]|nr:hypothetical protein [Halorubrum sp. SS7]TKX52760.1 hypothetical protein EXE42_15495 [Halorubrum sp. SP3]TKX58943.1 hypothetical protein EXE44_05190 [Halorubrum sp. SS7]TKX83984.1 hypothetical protein EXE43_21340 [Halorubrum sp. SS5]